MGQYLVLHTFDPRNASSGATADMSKAVIDTFSDDTYCVTSWVAAGAGRIACLWEAPSEQAVIDALARGPEIPIDGIYPTQVIDWARVKQLLQGAQQQAAALSS